MPLAQQGPGLMVWCGIINNSIIGPYIFDEGSVNGELYLFMLENYLLPCLCHRDDNDDIFFQQDGAQPHYSLAVRGLLDLKFPGRWIGRRGPIDWPPRSPDMTLLILWLWGHWKERVYGGAPKNL
jgi:hypothetical protein